MATARKLPSGSFRIRVYSHTDENGVKHYESFTASTKKEAEKMAILFQESQRARSKNEWTLGDALDDYIVRRSSVLSPTTIKDYKNTRAKHCPDLMRMKLSRITQDDVQSAINLEARQYSPKTVRNVHGTIVAVVNVYRPELSLHTALPKKVRVNLNVPVDHDIEILLDDVAGGEMELPVLLAALGPMRRGEICALMSDDINGNVVHVCKNMVTDGGSGWIVKAPKSYAGDRFITYPDYVAKLWEGIEGRIVDLTPNALTHRFERITKRLGLDFRFHDLRHYSASVQHAIGIPDAYIMQRGGWSSDAVLKNVYRHTLADKTNAVDQKVNDYFSKYDRSSQKNV